MVDRAEADAEAMTTRARDEAEDTVTRARDEAERLVAEGNASYQRSVDEGMAEQQRLVSEAEVVRRSEEEAQRIVSTAHADSQQLRTECDDYIDARLGEFEENLNGVLRTVTRDRAALRRGAGAGGAVSANGRSARRWEEPGETY